VFAFVTGPKTFPFGSVFSAHSLIFFGEAKPILTCFNSDSFEYDVYKVFGLFPFVFSLICSVIFVPDPLFFGGSLDNEVLRSD